MISTDTPANVIHGTAAPHDRIRDGWRDPRGAALVCLSSYLAVSGLVLAAGGRAWLAGLHVALIAMAVWSFVPRSDVARTVGDLLPLVVAPLLYGELPALIAVLGSAYHDVTVQRWEIDVFGGQLSRTLAARAPVTAVSEVLHAGYLAYYPAIFAPPLLLFARRERGGMAQTILALTITYTVCWTVFALMPVAGPRYLWSAPSVPSGPIRDLTLRLLEAGSSKGAAFPSSHMAVAVAQTLMAFRWQRRVGWTLAVVSILIGVGAVYGGFHYGVDMIAGALVGGVIGGAVLSCFRKVDTSATGYA